MSRRLLAASAAALAFAAAPFAAFAQDEATIRTAEKLRDKAMTANVAMDYLPQLTTRFGPRPAGSHSAQAAAAWAADYLKGLGFQNVGGPGGGGLFRMR